MSLVDPDTLNFVKGSATDYFSKLVWVIGNLSMDMNACLQSDTARVRLILWCNMLPGVGGWVAFPPLCVFPHSTEDLWPAALFAHACTNPRPRGENLRRQMLHRRTSAASNILWRSTWTTSTT